jgi:hypothetical protein
MRTELTTSLLVYAEGIIRADAVETTLTITLTLRQWKELQEQLAKDWPAWELSTAITDIVLQMEQTFYAPLPITRTAREASPST